MCSKERLLLAFCAISLYALPCLLDARETEIAQSATSHCKEIAREYTQLITSSVRTERKTEIKVDVGCSLKGVEHKTGKAEAEMIYWITIVNKGPLPIHFSAYSPISDEKISEHLKHLPAKGALLITVKSREWIAFENSVTLYFSFDPKEHKAEFFSVDIPYFSPTDEGKRI